MTNPTLLQHRAYLKLDLVKTIVQKNEENIYNWEMLSLLLQFFYIPKIISCT